MKREESHLIFSSHHHQYHKLGSRHKLQYQAFSYNNCAAVFTRGRKGKLVVHCSASSFFFQYFFAIQPGINFISFEESTRLAILLQQSTWELVFLQFQVLKFHSLLGSNGFSIFLLILSFHNLR